MRRNIVVRVRDREDRVSHVSAVVWSEEIPPEYVRGRNRKMKSKKYKREQQMERLRVRG